jgi:hypothetical protein
MNVFCLFVLECKDDVERWLFTICVCRGKDSNLNSHIYLFYPPQEDLEDTVTPETHPITTSTHTSHNWLPLQPTNQTYHQHSHLTTKTLHPTQERKIK